MRVWHSTIEIAIWAEIIFELSGNCIGVDRVGLRIMESTFCAVDPTRIAIERLLGLFSSFIHSLCCCIAGRCTVCRRNFAVCLLVLVFRGRDFLTLVVEYVPPYF